MRYGELCLQEVEHPGEPGNKAGKNYTHNTTDASQQDIQWQLCTHISEASVSFCR
jgi:hypothetical protein